MYSFTYNNVEIEFFWFYLLSHSNHSKKIYGDLMGSWVIDFVTNSWCYPARVWGGMLGGVVLN